MAFLIAGLLIHLFLLVNLRFEAWPEIIIYPWLMDHGFKLYQDIINPYLPGLTGFLYLFFRLFGFTLLNWQLLTWSIILTTDLLIYFIASRRYGQKPALLALTFFIIFQPLLDGNGLWFDLATTPLLLLAFYLKSPFLLATAFFIKQSTIWLFPLMYRQWKKLLAGLIILFAISYLPFALSGTAADYLFWPWRFALTILPTMPGHKDFGSLSLWLIAVTPFLPMIFLKKTSPFLWTILSFLFVFPRFGLFHLQPALAFAALSLASSLQSIKVGKLHFYVFMSFILIVSLLWIRQIKLFWRQPPRFFEPEIYAAAQKLSSLTLPNRPIFMLNAPDQLLFLSNRLPTKPWAITFPWYFELPGMQARLINSIREQQPQAVIFSPYQIQDKFKPGSYRPQVVDELVRLSFPQTKYISDSIYLLTKP